MSKIIIGKSPDRGLRTNVPTSEKFNCQALKDRQKKKEEEQRLLKQEIERRNNNEYLY